MEYKAFDNKIILRLDPGEEICNSLLELAERENIMLADISGLGAVNDFTVGVFYPDEKEYHSNHFRGNYEIVSLTGTLTRKSEKPYIHVHMSAGDAKGNVVGGHLNSALISATAEIVITVINGYVSREFSNEIGLNLIKFISK